MKKLTYLILALLIVACTADDNNNVDDTQAEWLYVHTAIEANATNSSTLVMPVTNDIFAFTDRPNREYKYISAYKFVSYWSDEATNSFQLDPPNAVLTSVGDDGVAEVEVVIINASTDGDTGNDNLAIGQSYQGGIIAYIDSTRQHGLIAATTDSNNYLSWGDAMNYCDDYSVTVGENTYDDWYLPSKDELNQLYEQQTAIGGFTANVYWSRTGTDFGIAWVQGFVSGNQFAGTNLDKELVRAVRTF